jgi:putative Mg2+ transporter-C (MgtC) family protein
MNVSVDDVFTLPDMARLGHVLVRVLVAAALGGLLGAEREAAGKAAGLRTHMLVALGAALFVLFPAEAGMSTSDLSRVIQGVATGIGFIGAGTILQYRGHIRGLTTAASLWSVAAIGTAAGAGLYVVAVVGTVLILVILSVLDNVERFARRRLNLPPDSYELPEHEPDDGKSEDLP